MSENKTFKISLILLGQVLNVAIQILFTPYLTRTLNLTEYGTYGQVLMLGDIANVVFGIGLTNIIYFYFHNEKRRNKGEIFKTFLALHFILGLLGYLTLVILSSWFSIVFENKSIELLLKIYGLNVFFVLVINFLQPVLILNNLVKKMVVTTFVSNLIKIILLLLSIGYFRNFEFIFYSFLVASLLQVTWLLLLVPREYYVGIIDWRLALEIIKKGSYFGITAILGYSYMYASGFFISYFLTPEKYAIYKAGAIEIPVIGLVYNSLSVIILPEVSKLYSENKFEEIVLLKRKVILQTASLIYPIIIFVLIFSAPFVNYYLSSKFAESTLVFVIFNLILFLRINDFHDILTAAGKGRLVLVLYLFYFALNVILNIVLIKFFSCYGGAMATFISVVFILLLMQIFSARQIKCKVDSFFDWTSIIKLISISLVMSGMLYFVYTLLVEKYAALGFTFLVILATIYFITVYKLLIRLKIIEYYYIETMLLKVPFGKKLLKLI